MSAGTLQAESFQTAGEVTRNQRLEAKAAAQRIARIDRQGDIFIRKYTLAAKQAALAAYKSGEKISLDGDDLEEATNELVGLSVLAYMFSMRRTRKQLSLSAFDDEVERIADSFDIDLGSLTKNVERVVGPRVKESLRSVRRRMNETLSELSANKIPTKQATRILTQRLEQMGVAPNSPAYVETLVRTHAQMTYNAAQYVELQKDDEIWGYKYVTVGDDRVRPDHERLDGLTRKKDDAIWLSAWPPNGWNCRCQILTLYDAERQTPVPKNAKSLIEPGFKFNPGVEFGV